MNLIHKSYSLSHSASSLSRLPILHTTLLITVSSVCSILKSISLSQIVSRYSPMNKNLLLSTFLDNYHLDKSNSLLILNHLASVKELHWLTVHLPYHKINSKARNLGLKNSILSVLENTGIQRWQASTKLFLIRRHISNGYKEWTNKWETPQQRNRVEISVRAKLKISTWARSNH